MMSRRSFSQKQHWQDWEIKVRPEISPVTLSLPSSSGQ